MTLKKQFVLALLLFASLMVHAQKGKDPIWYTMMHDPNVNFHKAITAHQNYWKAQKLPPVKELRDLEDDAHKHLLTGMNVAEIQEYKRILLMNRDFENWVQEESSWVQPNGHVLTQTEKSDILKKQRQELKAIEEKQSGN